MPLESGRKLGPYEIVEPIGKGGMGEVYRARDTRLDRTVAIKVLPEQLAEQAGFRERFEREAKTVSGLNHPHICTLYDVGSEDGLDFLVLELLEGETLQARLERGALPLKEAFTHAVEIAGALARAHDAGVVHRDLKPGNIFLTKSGAKLLDFGLATAVQQGSVDASSALSAMTEAKPLTQAGTVLGTFQYMSPEQLEAKEADARSDIFAFGAVLYEMVTGRKAFEASSQALLITAIMSQPPPELRKTVPEAPSALDRCLSKCLAKDPDARWRSAHDLKDELVWAAAGGASEAEPSTDTDTSSPRRNALAAGALGLVLGAILTAVALSGRSQTVTPQTTRLTVDLPFDLGRSSIAISPDGSEIVYKASLAPTRGLHRRLLNEFESTPIAGTEDALYPFFTKDGRSIGFFADDRLKTVPSGGGPPKTIASAGNRAGASWSGSDIVYAHLASPFMFRVSDEGGPAEELTGEAGQTQRWPDLLPGGRAVLFTSVAATINDHQVGVRSLETGETKMLLKGTYPRYVPTGHLLFAWQEALWAVPFDLDSLDVVGEPTRLIDELRIYNGGMALYSVSDTGTLAYRTGIASSQTQLFWIGRDGKREPISEVGVYDNPELSPDGSQLIAREGDRDLVLFDLNRGTSSRFKQDGEHVNAVWAPDGKRLAFGSRRGSGDVEFLIESTESSDRSRHQWQLEGDARGVVDWPQDGQSLLVLVGVSRTASMLGSIPAVEGAAEPSVYELGGLDQAQVSPDGRWLAYTANFRGIVVTSFPDLAITLQVSDSGAGAHQPRWSPDGDELFYRLGSGSLVSVRVHERGDSLSFDSPTELFGWSVRRGTFGGDVRAQYDVGPEGDRFVVAAPVDEQSSQVRVIVNWFEELKRLAPIDPTP